MLCQRWAVCPTAGCVHCCELYEAVHLHVCVLLHVLSTLATEQHQICSAGLTNTTFTTSPHQLSQTLVCLTIQAKWSTAGKVLRGAWCKGTRVTSVLPEKLAAPGESQTGEGQKLGERVGLQVRYTTTACLNVPCHLVRQLCHLSQILRQTASRCTLDLC